MKFAFRLARETSARMEIFDLKCARINKVIVGKIQKVVARLFFILGYRADLIKVQSKW
jgi:hypothetical protein